MIKLSGQLSWLNSVFEKKKTIISYQFVKQDNSVKNRKTS